MFNKYKKYIYALIIFYFVWLAIIPVGFRLLAEPVVDLIKAHTEYNISVQKPKLRTSIVPNLKLSADKIALLNKDNTEAFSLTSPKLNIRILPLISAKVHINSFQADDIKISAAFRGGKLYLGNYLIEPPEDTPKAKIKRVKIKNLKVDFDLTNKNKYALSGENLYFKNTRSVLICHGKITGKFYNNLPPKYLPPKYLPPNNLPLNNLPLADFDIRFPHSQNLKKTKFNINIKNFDLSPFSEIIEGYVYNEIDSLKGTINLSSNDKVMEGCFDNLGVEFKDKTKSMIFPKKLKISAIYKIGKDSFDIKNAVVNGDKITASAKGNIRKIFSSAPVFDIVTDIEKSDIREGVLMLPPIVTEDISIPKLKQYPFYGWIFGQLKIKGKFPEPNIYGNIKVTDGVLIKPLPNTTQGAGVNIDFTGKQLVLDVVVPAGGREVVYVSGDVMLYGDKYAHLKVKSSKSVDLNVAEHVVNPLHEILCFMIGPVPIMDVHGRGNIDIRIEGTKKDPHIWGDFNFINTSARFLEINHMKLEHADGNLNFNNQNAHFINNKGTLYGQKTVVDGTCTLFGDLDFDVKTNNQNLSDLVKILTTSPMLADIKSNIPQLSDIKGKSDFYLHLKGKLFDINDLRINENVIPSGYIKLLGNSLKLNGVPATNVRGQINYDKDNYEFNLKSFITSTSDSTIVGKIKNRIADLKVVSPRIKVNEIDPKTLRYLDPLFIKLNAQYKGRLDNIEIKGVNADIAVIKDNKPVRNGKILSGKITLKNSNLNISNLNGVIKQNPFYLNLNMRNIGKEKLDISKAVITGKFNYKSFDLTNLNLIKKANILPMDIQKEFNKLEFKSGYADISANAKGCYLTKVNAGVNLRDALVEYIVEGAKEDVVAPVKIVSGNIGVKNNTLVLNKLNCLVDNMPVLLYGEVKNFHKSPQYNLHINSKIIQRVFDKYWNANNIYPVKVNGDILLSSLIKGNKDKNKIKADIKLEENSSIYYMGATVGDKLEPITINLDADIEKTGRIKLNSFKYNKLVSSQNNKSNVIPMLSVQGELKNLGKIYELKNLVVKTENPTNANLFNIIFKKPTIKSGNFVSDIRINGYSNKPKIIGNFRANNVEMPYLNTSVKDLSVVFKPDVIQITTNGNVLDNYIMVNANLKNNLIPPYRVNGADIYINEFDIDNSLSQLKQIELKGFSSAIAPDSENSGNDIINSVILNNVKLRAGSVKVRNIKASNLEAVCSLNERMHISVDSFKFNMASGTIWGKVGYNLLNNFTQMELNSKGVNANELTIALFDLPNQIYGSLTGSIELSFNGTNDKTRLETLSGYGKFNVENGKMPKLGSLEYLLRAGNLIKGGITGLTMNGIIDVVTPMKTGEFSSIDGRLRLKDGIIKTLEIRTLGKSLNLYLIGSVNLSSQIADLHVYGQLSRKVSTILGAAGNISLNTLFNKIPGISLDSNNQLVNDINKIPGIELSNKSTRRFMVEILGDISGDDFVKSFKWIN